MSIYKKLNDYWTSTIVETTKLDDVENVICNEYNVYDTFIANDLFQSTSKFHYLSSRLGDDDKRFLHNEHTICLLFPGDGLRIACTKNFIKNIPYVQQLLSGQWSDNNIFQKEYYCDVLKKIRKGSVNIVINNDMESILYDKTVNCQVRNFEAKNYFTIVNVICSNLLESVMLTNKTSFDDSHFMIYRE
tara:strand:+ start:255 stop:821 length:567 start_codon:yes stop_codon:yes gene_type:complete